ncbi:hypothetical protein MiSe_69800 [Microseira wollei NIES-4236]|uniref:Uncharacterized protein n=1 Tax=Microseira wollei NIES-4236 TaxID=2530354 RepID=A0AAV3XKX6_9CYAN|nr:hypothetical protein MiSe_69800 [Microseira wollei NIES-4236]
MSKKTLISMTPEAGLKYYYSAPADASLCSREFHSLGYWQSQLGKITVLNDNIVRQ